LLQRDKSFDEDNKQTLHCVAIAKTKAIKSIRELSGKHVSLLKNINDEAFAAIQDTYKVPPHKVLAYLIYQPEYYHLHVHFVHAQNLDHFHEQ
jgi:m7GpppX diphosphatase